MTQLKLSTYETQSAPVEIKPGDAVLWCGGHHVVTHADVRVDGVTVLVVVSKTTGTERVLVGPRPRHPNGDWTAHFPR